MNIFKTSYNFKLSLIYYNFINDQSTKCPKLTNFPTSIKFNVYFINDKIKIIRYEKLKTKLINFKTRKRKLQVIINRDWKISYQKSWDNIRW